MKNQEVVLRMALMFLLEWCHDACLDCSLTYAFARVSELRTDLALAWLQAYQAFVSSR